jgi:O-antigen ligase
MLLFIVVASTTASRRDVENLMCSGWPNPRPASTIGHPVPLAAMLSLVAPFSLAFFLTEGRKWKRWMWAAAMVLFVLVVASTLSRGPWAGLTVASVIVLVCAIRIRVIEPRRTWIYGAVAAGVILLVFAVAKFDRTMLAVHLFTARID